VATPVAPVEVEIRTAQAVDFVARHGLTSSQYQTEFNRLVGQGYRLVLVDGYGQGDATRYAAIWEKRQTPAWQARHGLTSSQYQEEFDRLVGEGYRLVHVSGYGQGNATRYAAIWDKSSGPAWQARHGLTADQYQEEFDRLVGQGYRLTWVSGYGQGNATRYAAIWEQQPR